MNPWMDVPEDEHYMRLALQMAEGASGQTGMNPTVGCVLVNAGRIVGMGAHLERGYAHAEIHALQMAGSNAIGATAYVTLEPCSHTGKTGPCSDALIAAGVSRVVIATRDPNPLVSGQGISKLEQAGLTVSVGILGLEAETQQEVFRHVMTRDIPFVTCKVASTLDGKTATVSGESKWITNEHSRSYVQALRHVHQGILVGVQTVIADDPRLTSRLEVPSMQPIRIIADSTLRIPLDAYVITEQPQHTIILTTSGADQIRKDAIRARGVTLIECGSNTTVDLTFGLKCLLKEHGIASILLEGGARLNGAMLELGLISKFVLFYAPKIIGGIMSTPNFDISGIAAMNEAYTLERIAVKQFGNDVCISGYPVRKEG